MYLLGFLKEARFKDIFNYLTGICLIAIKSIFFDRINKIQKFILFFFFFF